MDQKGRIIWGDQLLTILAEEILHAQPGATIIGDVKSSQVAFDRITACGGTAVMWKTGHSLIKEKMQETNALLAGEMSGHIYFGHKFYGFDDGIYAALRLLNIIAGKEGGLAGQYDQLPKRVTTPELRFSCSEKQKFNIVTKIKNRLNAEDHKIIDVDGIRVTSTKGWWLLRPSNTEAVMVARCEAHNSSDLKLVLGHLNQCLMDCNLTPLNILD